MKAGRIFVIVVFFIIILGSTRVNAQTIAVGRVFAEVVESVSASSSTISNFELAKSMESISENLSGEALNLGVLTINTGRNITCNIVLTPASLNDGAGNSFTLEPAVKNEMTSSPASSNGIQRIELGAIPAISQDQASGMYEGSYTVVFAYN